ncbi:MARTX multifunctional-autoprocessing repeats-in-toxin holotoxin RtxA [Vibrio splendidus]|uniref:MARTX multifunctional-autoprocessing repeats-in-toxin holotoxin RtxA n=1 Tax=Vibrio splendidus TaxID=29497 RepID=A0A7Y4D9N0_VIBSP|nr:MARTX multifunctional-autoprocessing repeats-in-toxin holotoxin RtxA [Vibrio splendidus]NOJ14427.1 MARTX multifunctional-autoprocessing repeats-in-toxin holotoxin RtxA [Vibrio splendidus]
MGKPFWRSVEYFFTGNYSADEGNNNIVAIGFGGEIHARGGDDHVTVGSIGATVYTGSGNDTVVGGAAYLRVEDSVGNLNVKGAAGYADINKSGDGNVSFAGAAGGVSIDHLGNRGDVNYGGVAAYNGITRKGLSGNVTFGGAGGYNSLWHETNQGNLSFTGAGAGNKLDRTWFNKYQGSRGNVTFDGVGAANSISSRVETGNITFRGAGADNHLVRKGKVGDITLQGAGASNRIERTRQSDDVYVETRGNIRFEGVGGYNSIYSDVAHGDIHFSGGGAYNKITRKGSGSDFKGEGLANANAGEIVLTAAQMHGLSIGNGNKFHSVKAIKSEREANTYLFAIADGAYTKINKIRLYNDSETGNLKYYSEAWYKRGNHLASLARSDVSGSGGFESNPINGGYTLSNIELEHQQVVTIHAVEKDLTEYEWVTYANGALIDAEDVVLADAKMGGHAISTNGTTVDVKGVKSNRKSNTYVYAKVLGPYTKIVVVELANDSETGELKYQARSWYKEGNYTGNLANEDISTANGYHSMGRGGYSLSDLQYSVNAVRSTSETVADIDEYNEQALIKPSTDTGESSGDVRFNGIGGGNVIKSNVTRGDVHFNGGGIANVILHSSKFGDTEFIGGGAANVIVKSGDEGDLTFRGAGLANVLVHQSKQGKMDVYAGGAVNVLVRIGDGEYLAHLLAYGNISVHKGNGNSRLTMLGGYNTHTQIGSGNGLWLAVGGFNVMTQVGKGDIASVLVGGANVMTKVGDGDLTAGMLGGANIITHISGDETASNTTAVALGGANILTKKGNGNALAVMGGGANVLTHVGDGSTTGVMVGGANILTKVGDGDTTGIMLGIGNVLTHVGDGQTIGVMGAAGNIFTKVGDGTSIAAMIGVGNIFTHVGEGNAWALMGGLGNVFTKVGHGDALALMVAEANVFTHIGDGTTVALMVAKGNIATKVGNGTSIAAMVGNANIFTQVGNGSTFAAMLGQANIMTKVGNDLTAALMIGKANIYTHVGDGTSLGLFAGELNVMTKVGNGTTLAAMFGKANIMTHVGDGLTGVLALGEANIITKVGDDFMGVVAAAKANVVTHVGDATTAAVLAGKGNILTKVGEGTTVGLLISKVGNVMTHVGDGTTIGLAKGKANIITKVGDGLGVNVAWGQANIFTHVGDGDRYNFAKGEANIITKVGDGQEVSVVQGKANVITHVGNGDDYTGAWGKANIITKVGDGRNVVLAKGEANVVTQVGDGDSFNALWSKGNIVTKVGDGMQVTAAKGKANITTTVGNGLSVTAAYGDANINTKIGDGISVNVAWGKYNVNTKVGDGLNVAVMKGKANVNIHVGDGLGINASYARNNVAIKVGNGDFYSLAVASSNTSSNKLSALFDNIKQTLLGVGGSQAINYLVQGDEASSSGIQKGRGAISTPEITKLDGFALDEIEEVGSDLGDGLSGSVTNVETPDLSSMENELNIEESSDQAQAPNLIVNGDFEQGGDGWESTHGVEASYSSSAYGVSGEGHGSRVTELDTYTNTSLSQDLTDLAEGEVIAVSFDFAKRAGISSNEGIEVLWNGDVVFSTSGDEAAWQQKTLKLTANSGSNRIEFKGTGHDDGLGYVLDNVVAKSETSHQANAVADNAEQNQAAKNAMSDKERAEADRQRLEQEKQKQLEAVSGSQAQLESTDQEALESNGQAQRDAVNEESEAVTKDLTAMAQGLDVLDNKAEYTGVSGDHWRDRFAGGLLKDVQTQLDNAKDVSGEQITAAKQTHESNQKNVNDSVAKSEAGVAKGEENRASAEQDITDAKADADVRKAEATTKTDEAKQAESNANNSARDAEDRGNSDARNAENKANQAQADAKGSKQNENDRPDRQGASGSGLSNESHSIQSEETTSSDVDTVNPQSADGRFSEGLTDQEQEALDGAVQAVNRLQINAGIRSKNTGSSITSLFTESNADSIIVADRASQDVNRKDIRISGVSLHGLGGVADISASIMKNVDGFDFSLLGPDDVKFIESTKRHLGKLPTDLPSKELKAVRSNIQSIQRAPSESNLALLELAVEQWQQKHPKEFAQRGELVKTLQFEIVSLQSHIQKNRSKDAGIFGIAIDPKSVEAFESKVVFDGVGRVIGLVEPLADDQINSLKSLEVVSPTLTNSASDREAAKTESESIVEFIYKLGQIENAETSTSEINKLAEQAKTLWMSGNVTQESAVKLFTEANDKLTEHPKLQVLASKLLSDAKKEKEIGQYFDNLFGRRFDSEIAHELVKTPTEKAINTSVQIGTCLVDDFDDWMHGLLPDSEDDVLRSERIQTKMEAFAQAITKDERPWFSRVPTLTQFLEAPNYTNFKTMMTQVDDGFGVIKVPFLAVKMAITPGLGMEMAPWKAEGDRFYQNVITKARSTSAVISSGVDGENQVNLIEKKTSDYGTALQYQPKGDTYDDFKEGRSVADGRILNPSKKTTFENNALSNGLSVVTGASGSTNIMTHLNQHIASKIPGFSVDQAYLNTLSFLVFDGGHSVNESLAVYMALQETGDARKVVLESYTANYQDLIDLVDDSSKSTVRDALDNALDKTLEFYKEHAHSASNELEALGGKRKPISERINESVTIENDDAPPRDKEPLSPLTRFLNNELFGTKDARRKVGDITQTLLGLAVEKDESQKVTLKGEAGRLSGYFHKGAKAPEGEESKGNGKVVLFLHGSGSSSEEQASAIRSHYQKQGIDMLAVNLRGYGESDGGPSEKGLYQDARTMFKYLVNDKGIDPSNIIIHGYSMGGPIAADLARYAAQNGQAVSGLLLDRPMPSMTKAITAHEVANPAGIVGALSKAVNGQFSVEKNLKGLPKDTPIMLLTDNEGLGGEGEKLRAKLAVSGFNVTGEQTFYGHEASNRLMSQYAEQIVSGLFNAEQAAVEAGEVLKGLEKDFKRYGDALKPDTSVPGKSKDIRTTKDFLNGYKTDHAKDIVEGFRPDMNIKQLVDLLVKGNWSAEQKGALAWEVESRGLKATFQAKSEKHNRLFRDVASSGITDAKASEQLAPQLLLLNLSNDGFGGRCDPLSKLILVAKQLESDGQVGVARKLLEKMYSTAAVLSNPTLYSETERANASKLMSSLAAIHSKNPMHDTSMKVWQEKLEGKKALTVTGVIEKITDVSVDNKPVLLELDAPGHAMAAWAKGDGENRVYGFYDPNAGVVEFSSKDKFSTYLTRFFGKSDLNMAQRYRLPKNDVGEAIFNRVVVMDGNTLATYKPTLGDKTTLQGILDLPVFDATPIKKSTEVKVTDLESLGNKTKLVVDLSTIMTKQELKDGGKVFAKPIGASYQAILDQVELVHSSIGRDQVGASFELNKQINNYLAEHPTSGRNLALTTLKEQVNIALFSGKMKVTQESIDAIAQTRTDLAARIYVVAMEEANGEHIGLTDMMVRWANEDPYLSPKQGYAGETPSDLGFDAKYHIELGEQYSDFKLWLEKSQSADLLSKAVLDEATKTVHLGYSYQELQDLTGVESVQMAFYFLKEAAKKSDPTTSDSAEMILLKKFADQSYISQLETDRMDHIEGIYRSSHETDVDNWDHRYSGAGYDELSDKLAGAKGDVEEQLSVLLNERKGLLIGEVHGSDVNGLRFVNEQMDALKKQGVTVIGLEHLRSDLAQPLIDNYLSTGIMSSELSAMIKTKHLDITLFENARANGMRILALDANSTARPTVQGTEHGLMYRAGAANNVAVDALQALPDGEKFVAIYGKAHLQSHKGIESFVPGITHRLGLPALKVSASDQFVIEQDDKTLRAVYDDVANKPNIDFQVSLNGSDETVKNKDVNSWERLVVSPQSDGGETRFEGQIIIQMENDSAVSKAAENLAGKHPDSTVVVQLDSDGNYRVIYGDPSKLPKDKLAGQLRWQLVGHGRDESENNNTHLSGYSADELAVKLAAFNKAFSEAESVKAKPDHISVVGCSLISDDKQNGFGRLLIQSMGDNDIRSDVSVRSSEVAVDSNGRKHTHDENGHWVQKEKSNKVTLSWDEQGEVTEKHERIRNGIAEGDIDLSRVGISDVDDTARGAIADNSDVFNAPEKRKNETESSSSDNSSNKLSYSGNIQVNVGDGEFTAVNWGTSNVGIKVGTGGFKSLAFGDNNVMVHVGDGKSKHSFDIGGYQALEGAQMFIGNRNVSFNLGQSNDLIVMMDKSIPTPPLVNPFDGASRISGVLKSIASSGEGQDWLAAQEQQWTLSGAKKFVKDMSGLDQSSSVDYTSLVDLDSQNERSSRGLKNDAEATLNKQYNQWLGGSDNSDSSKMSRADKFRQANEKLAFNFAVGGQGADIQMTTGNWNFMFGDNIQSILDTNLGSLFGLMTQQFSTTGQAKTTFTYSPEDLPRQLKNKLLGQLAGVGADTTLGDIFGVDYTAAGHIVSRTGESVDGVAILKEMLEVVGEFSGDQLQAFVDPAKLLDNLESGVNMGADGIKTFAETHGLKEKAPEEEEDNSSVSVNGTNVAGSQDNGDAITADSSAKEDRAFGFNSLNLPNLFATIFNENKQTEMKSLVENLKENLTADLLNMKEKTFDFLRNSGHLQGDGDINVSLGNYNFNWGGDGKDLGAYLGDNNNFWGGRGDDVYYATGTSNIFTGGEGNDMGVLMGRENMMFGGEGNDTAVVAGRINHVFLGAGDDESFVFGEGGEIDTGTGRDYVVTSGNYNRVDTGGDQDYSVTIGNNNQVELGAGNDFANVFGNYNRINASGGNDVVKLMGYNAVLNGGEGDDHLIAAALSKFSQFNGGEGSDVMVLGGFQNTFKGGTGVDSFVVSGDVIDNLVEDIRSEDNIVFNGIDWQKLWLERSGYDLKLSILRDPESDTDQAKFEHIGSVTFNDYFNGNRAQVVVAMGDQGTSQDHTVLSNNAVDALVQAMSGFEPQVGDNGFIDNLDSKSRVAITTAWSDVSKGNSAIS